MALPAARTIYRRQTLPVLRFFNTDREWIEVIRANDLHENINFWRRDKRRVHLPEGSRLYFRLSGSKLVAGRAHLREQTVLTVREAWDRFGIGNGVTSFERLQHRVEEVLKIKDDSVACLVLDNVELLDPSNYPALPTDFQGNQNPKD